MKLNIKILNVIKKIVIIKILRILGSRFLLVNKSLTTLALLFRTASYSIVQ